MRSNSFTFPVREGFSRGAIIPRLAAVIVFVCISLLLIYFLGMRLYLPLPTAFFWSVILVAIVALVFQIAKVPWPGHRPIIIAEILLLGITLQLIYVLTVYGSQDTDSIQYMSVIEHILKYGTVLPREQGGGDIGTWPLMLIWVSEFHHITGIPLSDIMKWVPSMVIGAMFLFLLYVFIRRVFKREVIALLAVFLMLMESYFIYEASHLKSEPFTWVLLLTGFYFLTRTDQKERLKSTVLFILCLAGVVLAHHLTSFILLLFLIVTFGGSRFVRLIEAKRSSDTGAVTVAITYTLVVLAFVSVFSYWMYVSISPLEALVKAQRVFLFGQAGIPTAAEAIGAAEPELILSLRGKVLFWGYYAFHAVFAIILLRGLLSRSKGRPPEFYSFTAFLFLLGLWGFVQLYFMPYRAPGGIGTERMAMLGWILGFAPLVVCILGSKRKWTGQIGLAILIMFMLFNIYSIDQARWDFNVPTREQSTILKEDYALAETVTLSGQGTAYKASIIPLLSIQGINPLRLENVEAATLDTLDWIVVRKMVPMREIRAWERATEIGKFFPRDINVSFKLQELLTGGQSGGKHRNKIYESKNMAVFR